MSTATVTMTREEAAALRERHDYDARTLTRTPKDKLADLYRANLRRLGTISVCGGPVSKDELVSAILDLRYPREQLNQAIHTLHHGDAVWADCPWCAGSAA